MYETLDKQQELMIKLTIDQKFRKFFFKNSAYRTFYLKSIGFNESNISAFENIDEDGFDYQWKATNNMNFDTYEANLGLLFKLVPNIRVIFNNYSSLHPLKYNNRYEELLRFVAFVANSIGDDIKVSRHEDFLFLLNLIRYYAAIFNSTNNKIKYAELLEFYTENKIEDCGKLLYLNPTLITSTFNFSLELILSESPNYNDFDILPIAETVFFYYPFIASDASLTIGNDNMTKIVFDLQHENYTLDSYLNPINETNCEELIREMIDEGMILLI
ncbi:MAG: hypothetical protein ACQUHE_06040 [Bacteroidia bacterium]